MYLTNLIFNYTFFHIAFYKNFKNGAILMNHGSFFQGEDSLQLARYKFLKINSSMAKTIKKMFQNKICIKKLLNFIIIDSFQKLETVKL